LGQILIKWLFCNNIKIKGMGLIMLEIKRFETGGDENGLCAYLNLNDYAQEDTIKCRIANIGDEIIPIRTSYNSNPFFSYETFEKYSKGNHYARIYVEVEYQPKELELDKRIFNTVQGINNYITDLETLHHIMNIRSVAYNKKKIKLEEFIWRGTLYFDQFGQTQFIYDQKFINDRAEQFIRSNTIYKDVFYSYCEGYISTFKNLPEKDEVCPHCGKGVDFR
jgi:hypothetical protein